MNLDQALLALLAVAALYRYHRAELMRAERRAEERYEKCDRERIQLHNYFYGSQGASFMDTAPIGSESASPVHAETDSGSAAAAQTSAPSSPASGEARYREKLERTKTELKRIARTRISSLGPALRKIEKQGRPQFRNVRASLDPDTAHLVREKIGQEFAALQEQIERADRR
ncbi:MAG TPA: hypothetical protein VKZ53_18570 [Candidatus Angelobacter sp.]|nr:hypothetical protein [Candidatus Angelobacter sp.]